MPPISMLSFRLVNNAEAFEPTLCFNGSHCFSLNVAATAAEREREEFFAEGHLR